jgi:hypothetical protein
MQDTGYVLSIKLGFLTIIDVLVILLLIHFACRGFSKIGIVYISYIFLTLLFSFFFTRGSNEILYSFRPYLYLSTLFINWSRVTISRYTYIIVFIFGLIFYCLLSLNLYFQNASTYFEDALSGEGRIVFHNDLLLPIGIVFCLHIARISKWSFSLFLYVCVLLFFVKLIVSMSRGLILISVLVTLYYLLRSFDWRRVLLILCGFSTISILIFILILPVFKEYSIFELDFLIGSLESRFLGFDNADWQEVHLTSRIPMYISGIFSWLKSPLFGNGFGFSFFVDAWKQFVFYSDSSILTLLINLGITGSIVILYRTYQLTHRGENYSFQTLPILKVNSDFLLRLIIIRYLFVLFIINSSLVASPINIVFIITLFVFI